VRGARNFLASNATSAESSNNENGVISSFDSDGFTWEYGSQSGSEDFYYDASGGSYVAWGWDAGANNASTGHSSVIYDGNGAVQRISGLGFSPDFVWAKARSGDTLGGHLIFDSIRGATKYLTTNSTSAENTGSTMLTSFDSDGFTLGSSQYINDSGNEKYVAWAWDAGNSNPASNSSGSITTTVKSNGDFSVITYSGNGASGGATIGHGLTSAPDWIMIKRTDASADWINYHSAMGSTHGIRFTNAAKEDLEILFKDTDPTDTVFTIGGAGEVNNSGGT
jgi:hypothetical protein